MGGFVVVRKKDSQIERLLNTYGTSLARLPSPLRKIVGNQDDELVHYRLFEAKDGLYGVAVSKSGALMPGIKNVLLKGGVKHLYRFQEEAIEAITNGKHTVIVAPTGNGKTEAFSIPIIQSIAQESEKWGGLRYAERNVKALFIYPTKALARDQHKKIRDLALSVGVTSAVFDGDTKRVDRQKIIDNPPDILITNPDMIHWHLRNPRSDIRLLINSVRVIVFDELHTYTGAFGSNVHFIILRLRRILGDIQLVGASATIPNAREFSAKLFDGPVHVVECKQGRRGRIHFVMMYPATRSDTSMIVDIISDLVSDGYKTLAFANSHRKAEIINIIAQEADLYSAVHRGGLPKEYRLLVENAFKNDELDVVVSTPTLELGIDIGNLDAVVSTLVSFTRLTQRIGRAGRKGQDSIAIVALRSDDPISEYYTNHPDTYFTDYELAYVEPQNEIVAYYQLLSAAMDKPIHRNEFSNHNATITKLRRERLLNLTKKGEFITQAKEALQKLQTYNIRGTGDVVVIKHGKKVLGERGMPLAARELHPGAIYLSAGRKYRSQFFKFKARMGVAQLDLVAQDLHHRTTALANATPQILEILERRTANLIDVAYCKLRITERTTGYVIRDIFTGDLLEEHTLPQPIIYTYDTRGFVFESPRPEKAVEEAILKDFASLKTEERTRLASELLTGAFHALEHVVIESSNMFTGGGSREIGGISLGTSGVIVIHDGTPGGTGLSKLLYDRLEDAISRSHTILKQCKCETIDGCPKCTFSYQCGNNNRPLFKKGGESALAQVLEGYQTKIVPHDYDKYESYI